ncbi:xylulokinase [Auraticoccus sp. F435]|uniref:Xylulose kinase n=1 Tax=Auraticoccus cholistanensis TaxID=2656650 RepID=A0A6A9V113_9ACTN|nr:xylulokinase [Auraticoccus cholistanensis]MVA76300.1 xylulokinase [Auraticoccus cholistanensis]
MSLVCGIDSSTQSCKVLVVDTATGTVVREGRARHPDGSEVDPRHWWDALQAAVADAGGLDDVAAVSVAGQQHGMVALDADGEVVRPALLWNDTRSAPQAAAMVAELGAEAWARRTGSVPVASFTGTKLRWLAEHEPGNAARVAAVALPHDWLTWRLLGHGEPGRASLDALVTDRSDASGTAYWSPATGDWDRELLQASLGHDAVLPRVLGPSERAGTTRSAGAVPDGLVVGPGSGDNAGAALGLLLGPGEVAVSIGTSTTVFASTEQPVADATGTVAGFADATGAFLPLVCTLNGARVLDTVATLLGVDHDGLGELALAAEAGCGGLVLQPWFEGERTPNLPEATATLFGMTLASTTRPRLARAAFEGLLCGLADGVEAVQRVGVEARRVLAIGGAARSRALPRIAAEVFDSTVELPAPGEYVALGAAFQAAWVLTGERPRWDRSVTESHPSQHQPVIRRQYRDRLPEAAREQLGRIG